MRQFPPRRIVCLTEETVETLYLLGEQDRIVGVSGYAVRPPQVRREKPRVSAFISADIPKILDLKPDLVLAFSDLQADIVAELVRAGVAMHVFNQRDIAGIFAMIRTLGALVGASDRADQLAAGYERRLADIVSITRPSPKPKVYFEEWDDPLISGIGWVRIDRDRGRRGYSARSAISSVGKGSDHLTGFGSGSGSRRYPGVVVRQESRSGQNQAARRMGQHSSDPKRSNHRNQVAADFAAWPGGTHRWIGCNRCRVVA